MVFGLYWRTQLKKADRWKGALLYTVTANFILCTAFFIIVTIGVQFFIAIVILIDLQLILPELWLISAGNAIYITIDVISQLILFYRCWIMWRQPLVMVFPSILLLAFFVISWATLGVQIHVIATNQPSFPNWTAPAITATFFISLGANALVTALMMYKIITAYQNGRGFKTSNVQGTASQGTGQHERHPLMPILLESGLIIFVGQLVQSIMYASAFDAFPLVSGSVVMLYGILTTVGVETDISPKRNAVVSTDSGRPIQLASFAPSYTTKVNPEIYSDDGHSDRKVAFPI